jgi:hypothetical protein
VKVDTTWVETYWTVGNIKGLIATNCNETRIPDYLGLPTPILRSEETNKGE